MQIGNSVINDETDTIGMYEYFNSHALVSDEITDEIMKYCDFSPGAINQTDECNNASEAADRSISPIDIYNIYAPLCSDTNLTQTPRKASVRRTMLITSLHKSLFQDILIKILHDWWIGCRYCIWILAVIIMCMHIWIGLRFRRLFMPMLQACLMIGSHAGYYW